MSVVYPLQFGTVREIHLIEPLHKLVDDIVTKLVAKTSGQPGSDWHDNLQE
jgi:hypothetical protein